MKTQPRLITITVATPCSQDGELWFSDSNDDRRLAKRMCFGHCAAQKDCLSNGLIPTAMSNSSEPRVPHGIWGGYDEKERGQILAAMENKPPRRAVGRTAAQDAVA